MAGCPPYPYPRPPQQAQSLYPPPPPQQAQSLYPPPPQPPQQAQSLYPPPPQQAQTLYPPPPPQQAQSLYPPPPKQAQSIYPPPPKQAQSIYPPPPQECQPSSTPPYPSCPSTVDIPSSIMFPPGTDPNAVACFQLADHDHDGFISDKDLQKALSLYGHAFQSRTVHMLIAIHTNWTTVKRIGPKEFVPLYKHLQEWKAIFERFDVDHSEKIDMKELESALRSLGYDLSPQVLDRLMAKFGKGPTKSQKAIDYSYFIECCLTLKGLSDAFKAKDTAQCGSVTFGYESFMVTLLPFMGATAT